MKLLWVGVALSLLIVIVAFLPGAPNESDGNSFSGEIMDAQCAQAGSHDEKMKEHDFTTTLQCALFCARVQTPGGRFVLYDKARKTVYRLDDQARVEPYATAKVTITGTFDAATKTIRIAGIESQ